MLANQVIHISGFGRVFFNRLPDPDALRLVQKYFQPGVISESGYISILNYYQYSFNRYVSEGGQEKLLNCLNLLRWGQSEVAIRLDDKSYISYINNAWPDYSLFRRLGHGPYLRLYFEYIGIEFVVRPPQPEALYQLANHCLSNGFFLPTNDSNGYPGNNEIDWYISDVTDSDFKSYQTINGSGHSGIYDPDNGNEYPDNMHSMNVSSSSLSSDTSSSDNRINSPVAVESLPREAINFQRSYVNWSQQTNKEGAKKRLPDILFSTRECVVLDQTPLLAYYQGLLESLSANEGVVALTLSALLANGIMTLYCQGYNLLTLAIEVVSITYCNRHLWGYDSHREYGTACIVVDADQLLPVIGSESFILDDVAPLVELIKDSASRDHSIFCGMSNLQQNDFWELVNQRVVRSILNMPERVNAATTGMGNEKVCKQEKNNFSFEGGQYSDFLSQKGQSGDTYKKQNLSPDLPIISLFKFSSPNLSNEKKLEELEQKFKVIKPLGYKGDLELFKDYQCPIVYRLIEPDEDLIAYCSADNNGARVFTRQSFESYVQGVINNPAEGGQYTINCPVEGNGSKLKVMKKKGQYLVTNRVCLSDAHIKKSLAELFVYYVEKINNFISWYNDLIISGTLIDFSIKDDVNIEKNLGLTALIGGKLKDKPSYIPINIAVDFSGLYFWYLYHLANSFQLWFTKELKLLTCTVSLVKSPAGKNQLKRKIEWQAQGSDSLLKNINSRAVTRVFVGICINNLLRDYKNTGTMVLSLFSKNLVEVLYEKGLLDKNIFLDKLPELKLSVKNNVDLTDGSKRYTHSRLLHFSLTGHQNEDLEQLTQAEQYLKLSC